MATVMTSCIDQIGDNAGLVWHCLSENGSMSIHKLTKEMDVPRDQVMQAIGWLAREDKVHIEETARGKMIQLSV